MAWSGAKTNIRSISTPVSTVSNQSLRSLRKWRNPLMGYKVIVRLLRCEECRLRVKGRRNDKATGGLCRSPGNRHQIISTRGQTPSGIWSSTNAHAIAIGLIDLNQRATAASRARSAASAACRAEEFLALCQVRLPDCVRGAAATLEGICHRALQRKLCMIPCTWRARCGRIT